MTVNPKVTAEVTLRVRLADGTWTNVSKETTIDPSDDLLDISEAAQAVMSSASKSALRALGAALAWDAPEEAPDTEHALQGVSAGLRRRLTGE